MPAKSSNQNVVKSEESVFGRFAVKDSTLKFRLARKELSTLNRLAQGANIDTTELIKRAINQALTKGVKINGYDY